MTVKWIKPSEKLPPQGKKILYFNKGDVYIVQRYGPYWLPIPFYDSKFAFTEAPELWAEFSFPALYTGKIMVRMESLEDGVQSDLMDIDELEKVDPEYHEIFCEMQSEAFREEK